jgi:hypothetical protein
MGGLDVMYLVLFLVFALVGVVIFYGWHAEHKEQRRRDRERR